MSFEVVVAHQGGWDEVLLFAIPVVVALAAVKAVEVRARRSDDAHASAAGPDEGPEDVEGG